MNEEITLDLEQALANDRLRREAAAREEFAKVMQEIQARLKVDLITVFRVQPSGVVVPGIEFKAR